MAQQHERPEQHNANNKDLRLVLLPRELSDSPANVLIPDANHLEDRRPKFTDHDEQPGENHRHKHQGDHRRQRFFAEAPLNPLRDSHHCEHKEDGHRNIHRKIETLVGNPVTGLRDVTHVNRVRTGNNNRQPLRASWLIVWHVKPVPIDKILDQFCVNDKVTAVRAVSEI